MVRGDRVFFRRKLAAAFRGDFVEEDKVLADEVEEEDGDHIKLSLLPFCQWLC